MKSLKTLGIIVALISALSSALFGYVYKQASSFMSPESTSFLLLFLAFCISSVFSFRSLSNNNFKKINRSHIWKFIALGAIGFVANYSGAISLELLHPPIVGAMQRSEVIFAVFMSALLLGERISYITISSLMILLIGMLLLYNFQALGQEVHYTYYLFPIFTAFCFSMISIIFQTIKDLDPSFTNACRLLITSSGIVFFPHCLQEILQAPAEVFIWLALAAFLGPFLNRVSYTYAARIIGVGETAIILCMAPVLSLILGMVFYQIFLTIPQILGILFIVLGTILVMIYDNRK